MINNCEVYLICSGVISGSDTLELGMHGTLFVQVCFVWHLGIL